MRWRDLTDEQRLAVMGAGLTSLFLAVAATSPRRTRPTRRRRLVKWEPRRLEHLLEQGARPSRQRPALLIIEGGRGHG